MTSSAIEYHKRQFFEPYRSTVAFDKFLSNQTGLMGQRILDLGCGAGANEWFFARKYPDSQWDGLDIDSSLFGLFHEIAPDVDNVRLFNGNCFNLNNSLIGKYDGVISLQVLSWLSEWQCPMEQICKLRPRFIALSSLFYEGDIEWIINVKNYERPDESKNSDHTDAFYNIYSLPKIKRYLSEEGYDFFRFKSFEIDIDIPKPDSLDWGTYTVRTDEGKRMQMTAAMFLPWYFIYAERTK